MKQLLASPSLQLVTYPASATAQSAEFASADCVTGLNEIGQIDQPHRPARRIISIAGIKWRYSDFLINYCAGR